MSENYICKIATLEEMEKNWNNLIKIHPNDNAWKVYKKGAIKNFVENRTIVYHGILNGKIISEATAMIDASVVQTSDGLVDDKTAYLSAFRTLEEFQGQGYFSKLYKFVENDLKNKGYTKLTLGVEPSEVKNMMIYFKYGFTEFVKTEFMFEPAEKEGEEDKKIIVNYYAKNLI